MQHRSINRKWLATNNSFTCRYKDFVGQGSCTQFDSRKNQGEYLCQLCGRLFELKKKKKMEKNPNGQFDQFQYAIVMVYLHTLCYVLKEYYCV